MKVALAQINPTVGDMSGNLTRHERMCEEGRGRGADLVLFPELSICGYPPRDLVEQPDFIAACMDGLARFAKAVRVATVVGFPERRGKPSGKGLYNSAAVIRDGQVASLHRKILLPTYDVFDERRHFEPGRALRVAEIAGKRLAITICEDAWNDEGFWPSPAYSSDPVADLMAMGADAIVNIAASPFTMDKRLVRARMLAALAQRHRKPLLFVNQVGGQDDLIFDGRSTALAADGRTIAVAPEFQEAVTLVDLDAGSGDLREPIASDEEAALEALVLGTRDYAKKCGFQRTIVGLSGGMDSSLVACVASRALGPSNVLGVAMPSRHSSEASLEDATALAKALGIDFRVVPIEPIFAATLETLGLAVDDRTPGLTEENLQARARGMVLMALSNELGHLLLSTGNKSEMAVGYCTLYGDMAGGLAVLADVPKTLVYRLGRLVNRGHPVIPESVFTKAPSAELRPGQADQDTLPPYDVLDRLIESHVEKGWGRPRLLESGYAQDVVDDFLARVHRSEHKRRQAPPGLKITSKAFGPGRVVPLAQRWRG